MNIKRLATAQAVTATPLETEKKVKDFGLKRDTVSFSGKANIGMMNELAKIQTKDGKPRFSQKEIKTLSKCPQTSLENIKTLATTPLQAKNIAKVSNIKGLDYTKAATQINALAQYCGKDMKEISFNYDIYDVENNAFKISATLKNEDEKSVLVDKNMNRLAVEESRMYEHKGKTYNVVKTNDYRNHTTSKVRYEIDETGYPIVTHEIRIVKDKNNKVQRTEYMSPSEVKGVYDIKYKTPDGKEETVSSGKVDKKTGITSVKKDMKSLDGTRTQYLYEDDPQGNRIIDYKITDKNGKVLLKNSQTFEKLDDNHFVSSKNGKSYAIEFKEDTLNVKNQQTQEENTIQLSKLLRGDKKAMINLLKKIPGEELLAVKDTVKNLEGAKSLDDCYLEPETKTISTVDDMFSFLHELGHSKDFTPFHHMVTAEKDVQKVYDEERKAFNKAFPNAQREHINYFIDKREHYSGELGGVEETVAETNAMVNSYNGQLDIAARAQYLQQYFPKTIAKMAEHLERA